MAPKDLLQGPPASLEEPSGVSTDSDCGLFTVLLTADEQAPDGFSNEDSDNRQSGETDSDLFGDRTHPDTSTGVLPDEPWGVSQVETPSGLKIYFQAGPKRLYRINGKEVPSVSEVRDVLDKPGLPWWGMKVGIAGLQRLSALMLHSEPATWDRVLFSLTSDEVASLLTQHKLTTNHVRDKAGNRGQAVHDALETWATKEILPTAEVYAPEEQGYVEGLKQFLVDSGAEAVMSEVMVGSLKHKYAGRFDLRAKIPDNAYVIVKTYPKRKPVWGTLQGGEWLLDLKTSKNVYDSHFLQLAAYEEASKECGYEPTVNRGVIHVTEDGRYELVVSKARFTDFKHVLNCYRALERLKKR